MTNFYNSGILKIKLVNAPEFKPNKARYVEFLVKLEDEYILLCSHFGDNFEEHPNIFSPFMLNCKPKSISFYDIDLELFENVRFAFRMKISTFDLILIESKPIEFIDKNSIITPYKKVSSNLRRFFLRSKNRFIGLSYKLIYDYTNTINIDIPTEDFSIISFGLCYKDNTCQFHIPHVNFGGFINKKFVVTLRNRTILLAGSPIFFTVYSLILQIFNGINTYSEGIYVFEIDKNIIEPLSCDYEKISWKININKLKFHIFIKINGKSKLLGECSSEKPCIEYSNDYIEELSLLGLRIKTKFKAKIINLKFKIFPLILFNSEGPIIYKKTYDLTSDECSESAKIIVTVGPNISTNLFLSQEFYINKSIMDEGKRIYIKFFAGTIGIIISIMLFVLLLILLRKASVTKTNILHFELQCEDKKQ